MIKRCLIKLQGLLDVNAHQFDKKFHLLPKSLMDIGSWMGIVEIIRKLRVSL